MSKSDSWCSPPAITDRLQEFFEGPVDVDPCSNARSLVSSVIAYTRGGLVLPWRLPSRRAKRTCYQNDPYSKAEVWTAKMLHEIAVGNVVEHIRLSMFSCSTMWWADMCNKPRRNPRILALKRVAFLDPRKPAAAAMVDLVGCRFEPALVYIGPRPARFGQVFAGLTRWSTWGRT